MSIYIKRDKELLIEFNIFINTKISNRIEYLDMH